MTGGKRGKRSKHLSGPGREGKAKCCPKSSTRDKGAATTSNNLAGSKHQHHTRQLVVRVSPVSQPVDQILGRFESSKLICFTPILLAKARQTHLGWLSILLALELGRPIPREGQLSFPRYLYELYGMVLDGVAKGIHQELGSELIIPMLLLLLFETALHDCPEPAIQHIRGLEALMSTRTARSDQFPEDLQRLEDFASGVLEIVNSAVSARQHFHSQCPEHPNGMFTWNMCVDTRPQLVQMRDLIFMILEAIRAEAVFITNDFSEYSI